MPDPTLTLRGAALYRGWLDPQAQARLADEVRAVVAAAPLFHPVTPSGKAMSVRMTSAGGWAGSATAGAIATSRATPTE